MNKNNWYNVRKELPEIDKDVLTYGNNGEFYIAQYVERGKKVAIIKNGKREYIFTNWFYDNGEDGWYIIVSHWMPLPGLPDGDDYEN